MSTNNTIDGSFIEKDIEYMARVLPDSLREDIKIIASNSSTKIEKNTAHQSILHTIGNVVVISVFGLERAVPVGLMNDYEKVIRSFMDCSKALKKQSFYIPPQIENAFSMLEHPELWD